MLTLLRFHSFGTRLQNVDLAVKSVTTPFDIHWTFVMFFNNDREFSELYDLVADPLQRVNLWDDPSRQSIKADLLADLFDNLVESTMELRPQAPV